MCEVNREILRVDLGSFLLECPNLDVKHSKNFIDIYSVLKSPHDSTTDVDEKERRLLSRRFPEIRV